MTTEDSRATVDREWRRPEGQTVSDYAAMRIREERRRRDWNTAELGERCGLTANVIENIENGRPDKEGRRRRQITIDELAAISNAFETGLSTLIPLDASRNDSQFRKILDRAEERRSIDPAGAFMDMFRATMIELFEHVKGGKSTDDGLIRITAVPAGTPRNDADEAKVRAELDRINARPWRGGCPLCPGTLWCTDTEEEATSLVAGHIAENHVLLPVVWRDH